MLAAGGGESGRVSCPARRALRTAGLRAGSLPACSRESGRDPHPEEEKPLAADPAAAHRIAESFRAAGVPAAVGLRREVQPRPDRTARQAGSRHELGDVFYVSTRRTGPFPVRVELRRRRHPRPAHPRPHDLTSWITGTRYTSIAARTAHRSGRPHEDLLAALGQLSDGTIAHHHVNWISPMKERTTIITGDRGCLVADTRSPRT